MILKEKLFGQLDFRTLGEDHDFKEDSVRNLEKTPERFQNFTAFH